MVQLAEKLSIHLLMCTESFNYFCTVSSGAVQIVVIVIVICLFYLVAPCDWYLSYYNVANGGFLSKPQGLLLYIRFSLWLFIPDFFTDERAKADYRNRLRYLVARYGYSTSVFAWEFFNEVCVTVTLYVEHEMFVIG